MGNCWIVEGELQPHIDGKSSLVVNRVNYKEFSENPLEPIQEVWEKYVGLSDTQIIKTEGELFVIEAWQAICESMRRMEGK